MVSLHIKHSFVACRSRKRVCHSACITATCVKVLNLQQLKLLFLKNYMSLAYMFVYVCVYMHTYPNLYVSPYIHLPPLSVSVNFL